LGLSKFVDDFNEEPGDLKLLRVHSKAVSDISWKAYDVPEASGKYNNKKEYDEYSDFFKLGCVLHDMLSTEVINTAADGKPFLSVKNRSNKHFSVK
jgi:hypothetical protein